MKKILVIDDHNDLCETLAVRLHAAGFAVETAGNGRQAIEKIRLAPPDLVVSDVQMPEMDGFALIKELKRVCREVENAPLRIPVIMMSGHRKGPQMEALFEMEGAGAFMEKPIDGKLLLAKVNELLGVS